MFGAVALLMVGPMLLGSSVNSGRMQVGPPRESVRSHCGEIAFAAGSPERGSELWTLHPDGSHARSIRSVSNDVYEIQWSPHADRIAFVGDGDIYIVDATGGRLNQLTRTQETDSNLKWSPDGTHITFDRWLDNDTQAVMVVDLWGNELFVAWGSDPVWSPDGTSIVYSSNAERGASPDLFVVNIDGSQMRRITNTERPGEHAQAWSDDGRLLIWRYAMRFNKWEGNSADLWILDLTTGDVRRATHWQRAGTICDAQLSPDGSHIAYTKLADDYSRVEIKSIDPWHRRSSQTTALEHLLHPRRVYVEYDIEDPEWSPEGDRLLYLDYNTLVTVDATGGSHLPIFRPKLYITDVDWAPC